MSVVKMIADAIPVGSLLKTPSGSATFRIKHYGTNHITLEVGNKGREFRIPNRCFEDALDCLRGKGSIKIGALHSFTNEETFDSYVKNLTGGKSAASYVAPMLEKAGIVEIESARSSLPAKIRLIEK